MSVWKRKALILLLCLGLGLGGAARAVAQNSPEDVNSLFGAAKASIYRSDWDEASRRMERLVNLLPEGERQAECMYWLAYALNRRNGDGEAHLGYQRRAATVLETMLRRYPVGTWSRQARALLIEVAGDLAREGLRGFNDRLRELSSRLQDVDLQLLALDSLMQTDDKTAATKLKKILQSKDDPRKRRLALMILTRHDSPELKRLLPELARKESDPAMRLAILARLLDISPSGGLRELERLINSSAGEKEKTGILPLFLKVEGGGQRLLELARDTNRSPAVRARAIVFLAQSGMPHLEAVIARLYRQFERPEERSQAAIALGTLQSPAAAEELIRLFRSEKDMATRRAILLALGRTQQEKARRFLEEILRR